MIGDQQDTAELHSLRPGFDKAEAKDLPADFVPGCSFGFADSAGELQNFAERLH